MKKIIMLVVFLGLSNWMLLASAQSITLTPKECFETPTVDCCEEDILNTFLEKYFILNYLMELNSRCGEFINGEFINKSSTDNGRETRVSTAKFIRTDFFEGYGYGSLAKKLFDQYERSIFGPVDTCEIGYQNSGCFGGFRNVQKITMELLEVENLMPSEVGDELSSNVLEDVALNLESMINYISNKENISREKAAEFIKEATWVIFEDEYSKYRNFLGENESIVKAIFELSRNDFRKFGNFVCKDIRGKKVCVHGDENNKDNEQVLELYEIVSFAKSLGESDENSGNAGKAEVIYGRAGRL